MRINQFRPRLSQVVKMRKPVRLAIAVAVLVASFIAIQHVSEDFAANWIDIVLALMRWDIFGYFSSYELV